MFDPLLVDNEKNGRGFQGDGNTGLEFTHEILEFDVPIPNLPRGQGLELSYLAPFMTLNSISNDNAAMNAGWAVDDFDIPSPSGLLTSITVRAHLAVRDVDGFVLRVGYVVHLIGSPGRLPAPPK